MKPVVLRSTFGQVLGWALWVVLLLSTTMIGITEGLWPMLQTAAITGFIGLLLHLILIRPRIRVSNEGVEIVNPFREFKLGWEAIDRIDTKWGLTLFAGNRKIQAWSAPAPGRHSSFRSTKFEGKHLPESSYLAGTIRPGDLVSSDSGAAAYTIRGEWERRRDLGLLTGAPVLVERWNTPLILTLGTLLVLGVFVNLG